MGIIGTMRADFVRVIQPALAAAEGFVGDGIFLLVILASDLDARPEHVKDGPAHQDLRMIGIRAASNLGSAPEALGFVGILGSSR